MLHPENHLVIKYNEASLTFISKRHNATFEVDTNFSDNNDSWFECQTKLTAHEALTRRHIVERKKRN